MNTTLTRVKFCQKCFDKGYPLKGQIFLAFGTTTNDFVVKQARRNGKKGFTPHIIVLNKATGGFVKYDYLCSICGTKRRRFDKDNDEFFVSEEDFKQGLINIKDWNAWVMYKNDEDFEL